MYSKGDIVLIPFPFSDQSDSVTRPALVVSATEYNEASSDIIVAMITTRRRESAMDVEVKAWREARLLHASWVRIKLATVSRSLVRYKPGSLHPDDMATVDQAIRTALGP